MISVARRPYALASGAAIGVGALAGAHPSVAVAASLAIAFVAAASRSLMLGVCGFAIAASLEAVPQLAGGELSGIKLAGGVLLVFWIAAVMTGGEQRRELPETNPWVAWPLFGLVAWSAISISWAGEPEGAAREVVRYALNAILVVIAFSAMRQRRDPVWLAGALVIAGVLGIAVGLTQAPPPALAGRLAGPIGDPNELALLLLVAIVFGAVLAGSRRREGGVRFAAAAGACLCTVGLLLTASRGGLIALASAAILAVVFGGRWRGWALGLATLAAVVSAVGYGAVLGPEQRARIERLDGGTGRADLWTIAVRMAESKPIKGVGVGNFQSSSVDYLLQPGIIRRPEFIIDRPKVAHNLYLHVAAELGVIGAALLVALLGASMASAVAAARRFGRSGDADMELLARGVVIALGGMLVGNLFLSGQFAAPLWLLVALGPALLELARAPAPPAARPVAG